MSLLNRRQVRAFVLDTAKARSHRFTRVSAGFLDQCEAELRNLIRDRVHRHPSVGRTLK